METGWKDSSVTATKKPEVEMLSDELRRAAQDLFATVNGLEERLRGVMLPEKAVNPVGEPEEAVRSPLASSLRLSLKEYRACIALIDNIKSRLEI